MKSLGASFGLSSLHHLYGLLLLFLVITLLLFLLLLLTFSIDIEFFKLFHVSRLLLSLCKANFDLIFLLFLLLLFSFLLFLSHLLSISQHTLLEITLLILTCFLL